MSKKHTVNNYSHSSQCFMTSMKLFKPKIFLTVHIREVKHAVIQCVGRCPLGSGELEFDMAENR